MTYKIPYYRCRLVKDGNITSEYNTITDGQIAFEVFSARMKNLPHEEMHIAMVNGRSELIGMAMISMGGLHGAAIVARDIFKPAIIANAHAIIMCHNHPSGDPTPSPEDITMTNWAVEAGKLIGIPVLDHIVICPEKKRYQSII